MKSYYITLFLTLTFLKVIAFISIKLFSDGQFFGGGNDSDYYDAYALGFIDDAPVNVWPSILYFLNTLGLYNRTVVSYILAFLAFFIIPKLVANLSIDKKKSAKHFWLVMLIMAYYPSLFFQSLDIYRDIAMLYLFLLLLTQVRKITENFSLYSYLISFCLAALLWLFRPYLGFACMISLLSFYFFSFRKVNFIKILLYYLTPLLFFYSIGFLDSIITYRTGFEEEMVGGSNINIQFDSIGNFIPYFLLSFSYQILGLYFPNTVSVFVFLLESTLFIYAMFFIAKNKQHSNKFIDFLVVFFVVYSTVWLLGNDNLGSATRLRIFSYVSVLIIYFSILINKKYSKSS